MNKLFESIENFYAESKTTDDKFTWLIRNIETSSAFREYVKCITITLFSQESPLTKKQLSLLLEKTFERDIFERPIPIPILSLMLEDALLGKGSRDVTPVRFPWLDIPSDCCIRVIFPHTGAAARFRIKLKDADDGDDISVYYDTTDSIGCVGSPYWEAYPLETEHDDDDTIRFLLGQEKEMIDTIHKELLRRRDERGQTDKED